MRDHDSIEESENPLEVKPLIITALMAALMAVGNYIIIPMVPVPIVLSNLFVLIAGLILPLPLAGASCFLFLFLGVLGLPVFAGGGSGVAHLIGPTGGYLVGYPAAVILIALIVRRQPRRTLRSLPALLAGLAMIYAWGVPWLKISTGYSWMKALSLGMIPFIPGDLLKGGAAFLMVKMIPEDLWRFSK